MSAAAAPTSITQFGSANKRSIGDLSFEVLEMPLVSGNVSAVVTAKSLHTVYYAVVVGAALTSYPTYSSNTATLAFTDPAATVKAQIILFGV